jgi:hypothetical protein
MYILKEVCDDLQVEKHLVVKYCNNKIVKCYNHWIVWINLYDIWMVCHILLKSHYIVCKIWRGKNIIKRTTRVNGHLLKLHFCTFERSQGKHNSLDCHNFFGIFSINCKVYMFKAWHKSKMFFACSKHSKFFENGLFLFFFKCRFSTKSA